MSRRGWVLFAAMCVLWGIPYLLIKVAVADLSPATLVLARTAIAALLLLPIAIARNELRPIVRHWVPGSPSLPSRSRSRGSCSG